MRMLRMIVHVQIDEPADRIHQHCARIEAVIGYISSQAEVL